MKLVRLSRIVLALCTLSVPAFGLGRITVVGTSPNPDAVPAEEISRQGYHDAAEAVSLLTGLLASGIGGRSEGTLYLRGFSIRHVPVLLDGIPVSIPFDGYLDLSRFRTASLAGIQLFRAGDSLTGVPGAFAGTLNLFTRLPEKGRELSLGSEGTFGRTLDPGSVTGWLSGGMVINRWYAALTVDGLSRTGFTLPDGYASGVEDGGKRANAAAASGDLSFRFGFRPAQDQEYAILFAMTDATKDVPPYAGTNDKVRYWRYTEWTKTRVALLTKTSAKNIVVHGRAWFDGFANTLNAYDSAALATQTNASSFTSMYDDTTAGVSLKADVLPLPGLFCRVDLFGRQDIHKEHNAGEPVREFRDGLFRGGVNTLLTLGRRTRLALELQLTRLVVQQADHWTNSTIVPFETRDLSALDGRAAFHYNLAENNELRLALTRRTRLPSMKERYSYRLGKAIPNPALESEVSLNGELAWTFLPAKGMTTTAAVFFTRADDYILDVTIGPGTNQNRNVGQVDFFGAEANADITFAGGLFRARGGYTLLLPDPAPGTPTLTGIAKHTFHLQGLWQPRKNLSASLTGRWLSAVQSSSDGKRPAGNALRADLRLDWQPLAWMRVQFGIKNLFDTVIEFEEGYPEPGREYALGVEVRF